VSRKRTDTSGEGLWRGREVATGPDRRTREVARRLHYSERTVKNVLHDVVTKLGARSRSHAVPRPCGKG
jgi:FixJ family two-component response regulator